MENDERFKVEVDGIDSFEEALAIAKSQAGPDRDVYLIETDDQGNEILVKITNEKES